MMKLGFIILAHQDLHRTTQLVRFLAKNGCPVSLHVDQTADKSKVDALISSVNHLDDVVFSKQERCGWGQFSIVKATLNAAEALFKAHPDVTNVCLISGSCLPVRPLGQLKAFLERHKGIDFIESFSLEDKKWVKGGLDSERFTLFFPVSWRKSRYVFDRLVDLQRFFKIKRTVPENISPHMGSQWWCLTAKTLRKIIEDPNRKKNDQYFSKSWIPDESYFQSLAQNHSDHIKPISLTFVAFDAEGKPFLFYDDHLDELPKVNAFFIRKVWPGAVKLYRELLSDDRKNHPLSKADEDVFNEKFARANQQCISGGEGRFLQGRYPTDHGKLSGVTTRNFGVLVGYKSLFKDFQLWAHDDKGLNVFSNIFARRKFTFRKKMGLMKGNLLANAKLRDANPRSFLCNFMWSERNSPLLAFQFDMSDVQKIAPVLARDKHAHITVIKEAWLLDVASSHMKFRGKLMNAQVLQAREKEFLKLLEKFNPGNYTIFSLEDALNTPGVILQSALKTLDPQIANGPIEIPELADISKLDTVVRKLNKNGVRLSYKPSKKKKRASKEAEKAVNRPYVVR
ncbi:beta-1,6-N-acetylglucosaminyltransferase [Amylibacter sp. SFDW26]|uniref:DUF5927 domain-containing protein n=1 Tax=Amylibacter sp. SFDW26 TaxID=2652722 RepID=UPI0012628E38|nr:beta-1,6-N-acetylglucosaminyltransferase [Amylibacter sp. SFDW26]KAB7614545.1 beta-1,6-N-acetylglucosaminyltransferase [Amylibacter sp. SFDW26]